MALELIYTSAPQGLRPGARGFCTVACTVDMTGPMVTTLEGLSGYAYPPQISSPEAAKNPHRFAHLRPTIGGRQYSVLSHVCAAGTNYQGRKNVAGPSRSPDPGDRIRKRGTGVGNDATRGS